MCLRYEQKEQTKMLKQQRTTVSFSDNVITHEIPKLNACDTAEAFYTRSDYKKFQIAQRMREDRHEAKRMRRITEDASATREAHALELARLQPPVDELLLVQPPSMPVRQVSSSLISMPVVLSRRPDLPARQAVVTDIWTANVKVSEPRKGPPTRPVRQTSNRNVIDIDMAIEPKAIPESLGSLLNRALAA